MAFTPLPKVARHTIYFLHRCCLFERQSVRRSVLREASASWKPPLHQHLFAKLKKGSSWLSRSCFFFLFSFQCSSQATDRKAFWCILTLMGGSGTPRVSMNRRWLHCSAMLVSQLTWLVGTFKFKTHHINPQTSSGIKDNRILCVFNP